MNGNPTNAEPTLKEVLEWDNGLVCIWVCVCASECMCKCICVYGM